MLAERLDLHERAGVDPFGDLAPEERIEAAGHDDRVERRVRDEPVHLAADEDLHPLAVLHRLDAPFAEPLVEVARERVEGLVIVVVGVDRTDIHGHGAHSPKKKAEALRYCHASRTSSVRSSFSISARQRCIDSTGWSDANRMRSVPRVRR
jgi:hypothetical protein